MKCIDYMPLINQIHEKEVDEFKQALLSHGGRYEWDEYESPILTVETEDFIGNVRIAEAVPR